MDEIEYCSCGAYIVRVILIGRSVSIESIVPLSPPLAEASDFLLALFTGSFYEVENNASCRQNVEEVLGAFLAGRQERPSLALVALQGLEDSNRAALSSISLCLAQVIFGVSGFVIAQMSNGLLISDVQKHSSLWNLNHVNYHNKWPILGFSGRGSEFTNTVHRLALSLSVDIHFAANSSDSCPYRSRRSCRPVRPPPYYRGSMSYFTGFDLDSSQEHDYRICVNGEAPQAHGVRLVGQKAALVADK
ncbi:hypothetical protein J6590_019700 [Homalodisca vitripennis]|nr:hypothetical protein J6590_019700 [Homalodisca vitripennis]